MKVLPSKCTQLPPFPPGTIPFRLIPFHPLQTAEMQKTLDSLKDALTTLEKGKAPAEAAQDAITLTDLRSELRALASSLNEWVLCDPTPHDLEELLRPA